MKNQRKMLLKFASFLFCLLKVALVFCGKRNWLTRAENVCAFGGKFPIWISIKYPVLLAMKRTILIKKNSWKISFASSMIFITTSENIVSNFPGAKEYFCHNIHVSFCCFFYLKRILILFQYVSTPDMFKAKRLENRHSIFAW